MDKFYFWAAGRCIMIALACYHITGCETITPELDGKVDMVGTLLDIGLKGYAVDSLYTEFDFYRGKTARISSFRKGIIHYENGQIESIASPSVTYGGSSIVYTYEGIQSTIMLDPHGFAEEVTNRYGNNQLHSQLFYFYTAAGYLKEVRVERPGQTPTSVIYQYDDAFISIIEDNVVRQIPLYQQGANGGAKQENAGYVCDVLRHGGSPLTNGYAIIPDLYYQGIYGIPVKYLPAEAVESRINPSHPSATSITRVGNWNFFYE